MLGFQSSCGIPAEMLARLGQSPAVAIDGLVKLVPNMGWLLIPVIGILIGQRGFLF